MKKKLEILSIAGIVIASLVIFYLNQQNITTFPAQVPQVQVTKVQPFSSLPFNEDRKIDFEIAKESKNRLTEREQRDQALDWLLLVTVKSSGLTTADLSQVLFDVSPIRHGYTKHTANFEYGVTRSRFIGNGQVVAIIPAETSANKRWDLLAHIADQHRKDLGFIPDKLLVFEYKLLPDLTGAMLRRTDDIAAKTLFDDKSGYVEVTVKNLDDFNRFLSQTEDLTYVSLAEGKLLLGGRKQHHVAIRNIKVEDVAALWQAEQKIQTDLQAFDDKWQAKYDEFNARWSGRKAYSDIELAQLEQQQKSEIEKLKLQEAEEWKEKKLVTGSGFSLDPIYDYEKFEKLFVQFKPVLSRLAEGQKPVLQKTLIDDALQGIRSKNLSPFFDMADSLRQQGIPRYPEALIELSSISSLQAARYDGSLQGTEAGMVLFYTDLLAKLWALDFVNNAPEKYIQDFHALTTTQVALVFYEEIKKYSRARLWFGTRDDGFQSVENGQKLIFARNATRVYAASNDPFLPGKEVEPSAKFEAFLGWWNDHYEEIAAYEPEYQRLNAIMKWSTVLAWMSTNKTNNTLGFLADVNVVHNNWFPDWVKNKPELKYQSWKEIKFYKKGSFGHDTETMPKLYSKSYVEFPGTPYENVGGFSGGVSLAERKLFEHRSPLTNSSNPLTRRSNFNYSESFSEGKKFKAFDKTEYAITQLGSEKNLVSIIPREKAKFRDSYSDRIPETIERQFVSTSDNTLAINSFSSNDVRKLELGSLDIKETGQGFKVAWQSREIDNAQSLARKLSRSKTGKEDIQVLMSDPSVEQFFISDKSYNVKLAGTQNWLKLGFEGKPGVELAKGWDARIADPVSSSGSVQMAWEEPNQLYNRLSSNGYISMRPLENDGRMILTYAEARAPPPGISTEIKTSDGVLKGSYNKEYNIIYVKTDQLPQPLRDPVKLSKAVNKDDFIKIADPASEEAGVIKITGNGGRGGYGNGGSGKSGNPPFDEFNQGNSNKMAFWLTNEPEQARIFLINHCKDDLKRVDRLIDQDPVLALRELESIEKKYGPVPDILAREAIAELKINQFEKSAETISRLSGHNPLDRQALLDEIATRLNTAEWKNSQNAINLGQGIKWGTDPRLKFFGDKLMSGENKSQIIIQLKLGSKNKFSPVLPEEVKNIPDDAEIYIQDSPGLNNMDWSNSVHQTLRDSSASNMIFIKALPRGDIKHYKPVVIFTDDGAQFHHHSTLNTTVKSGGENATDAASSTLKGGNGLSQSHPFNPNDDDCEDEKNFNKNECRVYFITEKAQGIKKS